MGNCCRGESSSPVVSSGDRSSPAPKKQYPAGEIGANNCSCGSRKSSKGGNLREVKIRMTKKELEELIGWLNMADSSFEHVMARLVNVITDQSDHVVKLRQQRSWRPSLHSIPEIH